ncbi:MAG: bile acid:sodium symporter family protein [Chitinophagaceae bacterium]|nr:MAG: bile acid:sodium symporter family protein [Chitinophagaceae bacterium]
MFLSIQDIQLNYNESAGWLLNIILAFVMLGVALGLKISDFKQVMLFPKAFLTGVFAQFILLPFLTLCLVLLWNPHPAIALGMFLVAACPGGNVSNFISRLAGANTALSISLTATATALSAFMTPINFVFWGSLYEPSSLLMRSIEMDVWQLFVSIFLVLALPLTMGLIITRLFPLFAQKAGKAIRLISFFVFVLFIVIAFSANYRNFIDFIDYVFGLVLIHNFLALFGGFLLATLNGLSMKDKKSITIETGIQNSGLGLLIIFSFFGGMGGMAIVAAWWGIWHIIAGLLISFVFSRIKS